MSDEQLSQLQLETEKLAEHIEVSDYEFEPDQVAGILRMLAAGKSAEWIIEEYELQHEDGA